MTVVRIAEILGADFFAGAEEAAREIRMAICSDIMSDVLSFSTSQSLLLTGLTNIQAVRTAEMADIAAICYVQGKRPGPDSLSLAREKGILLLSTPLGSFESSGRLHAAGLEACGVLG